jgi:hypothetical protein
MYQKGYVALATKQNNEPEGGVGVPGEIMIFVTLARLDRILMLIIGAGSWSNKNQNFS